MYTIDVIEVNGSDGNILADLSGRLISRSIIKERNRADKISLTFDLHNIRDYAKEIGVTIWDIFAVGRNDIVIKKNDTVLSAGQISWARVMEDKIEVKAEGYSNLLYQRFTDEDVTFSGVDAGQIAWHLIEATQLNGDLGITEGTIQESVDRDRTYSYKNIGEAIDQLTEVINGFDFEITWDKKLNVYYPKIGQRRDDIILTYPGNVRELSFERDSSQIVNKVYAVGSGSGVDAQRAESVDENSQERFGLRVSILQLSDVSESETLQQHADAEVVAYREFLDAPGLMIKTTELPYGSYNIGDEITIAVEDNEAFEPVNGWWRIDGIDLQLDENNAEMVRLRLMK
jgi:hypothetical protein